MKPIFRLLVLVLYNLANINGQDTPTKTTPLPTCIPVPTEKLCTSDIDCLNFGKCTTKTGKCECPIGFGGNLCDKLMCGSLADKDNRTARPDGKLECDCNAGWTGINCNVCRNDDECKRVVDPYGISDVKAVCYKEGILLKEYFHTCLVENEKLKRYLNDKKAEATFRCEKPGETCQFEVFIGGMESFGCAMKQCEFYSYKVGEEKFFGGNCAQTECRCIPDAVLCGAPDSVDFTDLMGIVKGWAKFECKNPGFDGGRYNCEFDQQEFRPNVGPLLGDNPVFELKCESGECMADYEVPSFRSGMRTETVVLILMCVSVVLLAVVLGYCCYNPSPQMRSGDEDEWERLMEERGKVELSFQDLSYEIQIKGQRKRVLRGISGHVKAGQVLAIMGPSGSGKTTCLDILANKPKSGIVYGQVKINGKIPTRKEQKKLSGFVDQEDTLLGTLTVYEAVLYSALLRLPKEMTRAAKEKRVVETLRALGIEKIRNSRIGQPGQRGISGGEKRRVSIAMEFVVGPSILFLDEPTSGLDSANALAVVESIVNLARTHQRTIVLTIHQPRSNIFQMFDKLLLLAEGGYMVYSGQISSSSSSPEQSTSNGNKIDVLGDFLTSVGFPCPVGFNVADYLLDLTTFKTNGSTLTQSEQNEDLVEEGEKERLHLRQLSQNNSQWENLPMHMKMFALDLSDLQQSQQQTLIHLVTSFLKSKQCLALKKELSTDGEDISIVQPSSPSIDDNNNNSETGEGDPLLLFQPPPYNQENMQQQLQYSNNIPWTIQFQILSWRTLINIVRNPFLLIAHYFIAVCIGLICAIVFHDLNLTVAGAQGRLGLFFFLCLINSLINLTTVDMFSRERLLFTRERSSGYYSVSAYFLSKVVCDLIPLRVVPPIIAGLILYRPVGLIQDSLHLWRFLLALVLSNLSAASLVLIFAAAFSTASVANFVNVIVLVIAFLFSGLFVNKRDLPAFIKWVRIYSPFNYGYEAMCINELLSLVFEDVQYGNHLVIPGGILIKSLGMEAVGYWRDIVEVSLLVFLYILVAFLVVLFHVKETR